MTNPNRVPQPTAVWRDPETPWDLTGTDDDVILVSGQQDIIGKVIDI